MTQTTREDYEVAAIMFGMFLVTTWLLIQTTKKTDQASQVPYPPEAE